MGEPVQNQSPAVIDYDAFEKERTARLQADLQARLKDEFQGRQEGLKQIILKSVVLGDYEKAEKGIEHYLEVKKEYPEFSPRVEQLMKHSKELINAIRSKRSLPTLSQLTMSKQKEIMDHVVSHFNELKTTLKTIERIAKDVTLSDIRSTVWLIKTVSYVVIGLSVLFFLKNFNSEIGQPFWVVFNEVVTYLFDAISNAIGL